MEDFLQQLNKDIEDIFKYKIETPNAYVVPTRNDSNLTFQIGADKKGKLLETCVLMIDIRNSTKISRQLRKDKVKLGKIYSAFIYAMTSIADEYGYVRNIVGDRIMVVFEPQDCFTNAINCAAVMYTVATKILAKHVAVDEFKVGIGIDFGEMLVLKTGIRKKHEEQSEYKSLVWIGDTANAASKLCDFANKSYSSPVFKIMYDRFNVFTGSYQSRIEKLSASDFAQKIKILDSEWRYENYKVLDLEVENQTGTTAPVLMSGKVYNEFKKANPTSMNLSRVYERQYPSIPYTGSGVYGGVLHVAEINKIKI